MHKAILIIESNVDGHYGVYLKNIVNYFLQKDIHVFLAVDDGAEASLFLGNLSKSSYWSKNVEVIKLPLLYRPKKYNFLINLWGQVRYWHACRKAYNKAIISNKIELIFIPYIDRIIYAIAILGSPFKNTLFSGIVMRPTFHHYEIGIKSTNVGKFSNLALKLSLFKWALKIKSLKSIFTIDLSLWKFSQSKIKAQWKKIQYFPDPIEQMHLLSKKAARYRLGIDADKVSLLLYGSIDMRKGVLSALEWVTDARSKGVNMQLLILGRQSEEVRQYLSNSISAKSLIEDDSLYILDRYIEAEEEILAFSAVDLVWLKYNDFDQMSGVMVKAGILDLPMTLPDQGIMGWYKNQLLKSDEYPQFSIPRLKVDPKLNPFAEHTWENSLLNLNSLLE